MKNLLVFLCVLAACSSPPAAVSPSHAAACASAGGAPARGVIFDADYTTDVGNWDGEAGEDRHTDRRVQARVPGEGPGGRDAFEIRQLADPRGDFYSGHVKTLPPVQAGESRFYRFYLWHAPENDYAAAGSNVRTVNKLLIAGSTGGPGSRMILNANGIPGSGFALEVIFDGWDAAPPETRPLARGVWHSIQVESKWGAGAYTKVWVNTDTYSRPTLLLEGGTFNPTSMGGYTHFGAYSNTGLARGGAHTFRHAEFEVGTEFDSCWHAKRESPSERAGE